jgi:protein tyrosine phosphatase
MFHQKECESNTPTLMHCSAGVGRTGVMIACLLIKEILPQLLEKTKDECGNPHPEFLQLDVEKLLVALRQQRKSMIQTKQQLHSVIEFFRLEVKRLTSHE